jgi:ABC-type nitrate/sulfonate/bicarbonate transport system substrate-binding protein
MFGMKTKVLGLAAAAGVLLACSSDDDGGGAECPPGQVGEPATVRVRSASRSMPILAALANGFFADENLTVDYAQFESSRPTFVQVSDHEMEVIISSTDNAINYQLNPGNAAGGILDVQIIFAHDEGLGLALVALPEFTTAESLRGQTIGVDVPGSGFALPVAKIMREHGMEANVDYMMASAGGSPARLDGLLTDPPMWQAAIINAESVVRARQLGLSVIGAIGDIIQPYLGGAAASSRWWLQNNPDVAERFIRGFYRGTVWVQDAANRDAAIDLLVDDETTPELAGKILDLNVAPDGLSDGAKIDPQGLLNVLALRDEFDGFEEPQDIQVLSSSESDLYDESYYTQALEGLNAAAACD